MKKNKIKAKLVRNKYIIYQKLKNLCYVSKLLICLQITANHLEIIVLFNSVFITKV